MQSGTKTILKKMTNSVKGDEKDEFKRFSKPLLWHCEEICVSDFQKWVYKTGGGHKNNLTFSFLFQITGKELRIAI